MTVIGRRSVLAGTAAALFAVPRPGRAQGEWPKGPLKIVVPFPPGGSADPVARILQAKLIELTGWNVVVENKPGGTGVVGAAVVAKSPPDGQTWMLTFDSHILNPAFAAGLPYKDSELFNVMEVGRTPQVVVAHPDRPYRTLAEAIADARKHPGKVSMGVLGASQALVLMTLLKKENDVDLNLIPYKGGGPLNQDILGGVTDIAIGSLTSLSPHIRSGKVRAIGVTSEKRTPALPDTATLIEQGIKTYPSYSWWGIYVPSGTPGPIIDRMHAELTKAARSPDVTQKFVEQFNMETLTTSPEQFAAYQKSEQERWFKVIRDNNIQGD
ncbi:Tripartite-type tricarboxylate transporter, receptor component TctC [Enhydrobacter aerosaccus]|uniref:Tripartite-type tricarboxylate transporter, receptor component TctC n=1 Tax=Enhydrobacter aerosaccus TaxID=225324 RepID=A0A1T4KPJ0_9HYPH|nr:tripartite tricarboxylate transporter substrate-binding protein [Enhydrobacter aerosaccus]SJZ44340.1 Tripartite-type tricarboxylate transporter, receptor component TctC [Enhydrobacter aerosaccus]